MMRLIPRNFFKPMAMLALSLVFVFTVQDLNAQNLKAGGEGADFANRMAIHRANYVKATEEYKSSLETLMKLYQDDITQNTSLLAKHKELFEQGIISKRELEKSEEKLTEANHKLDEVRKQYSQADNAIAEIIALEKMEQMEKLSPGATGKSYSTAVFIKYRGTGSFSLSTSGTLENFFEARFHRPLPISAFGQSATHDHLGYDHRNAMDVALHPDSLEGQALMAYLQTNGIPFLAFRQAVPGSSTGAHIHIGLPSHRL